MTTFESMSHTPEKKYLSLESQSECFQWIREKKGSYSRHVQRLQCLRDPGELK